ncbi:MAG TPA: hypothetical protein VNF74_01765 [Terriglobales bacterium]|nr:hypothetical protein [Terriglobales bacterium]
MSPRLLARVVRSANQLTFAKAAEDVTDYWGMWLDAETVRRVTEAAGAAYVAVQEAEVVRLGQDWPAPPQGAPVMQVSVDGAFVPLRHGEWAEVKTLAIGTVTVSRNRKGESEVHTTDLSYFSRLAEAGDFTHQARGEVHRRGVQTAGLVAAINDGSPWTQGIVEVYRPDATRILDFPHPLEHLTLAAQATYGAGSLPAQTWWREQAHALKQEGPAPVLAALRLLPVESAADPVDAAKAQRETLGYLGARLDELRYPDFLAQGLPIGDGAVESANKLVVEARLKGSGMRWERSNVNPLVALRTALCSKRWVEAWTAISAQLRQQDRLRRRARWLQRHPPAAPPTADPAPAPPNMPLLRSAAKKLRERAKPAPRIVDGRPTKDHPWRQPLSHRPHREAI